jgi:hypothetical protein
MTAPPPVWHPEALAALFPRRGAKKRSFKRDAKKLEAALRAFAPSGARFREGLDAASPPARELAEAALAHAETLTLDPSAPLVPRLFGALLAMAEGPGDEVAPAMLAAFFAQRPADALISLVAASSTVGRQVGAFDAHTMHTAPLLLQTTPDEGSLAYRFQRLRDAWETLRAAIAGADEAEHAAAKDAANELRAAAPSVVRCAIAFAFPDEPSWADEEARAFMTGEEARRETFANMPRMAQYGACLLASVGDAEVAARLLERIVERRWYDSAARYGLEAVRAAGEGALPPLLKALAITQGRPDEWKYWASELRHIATAAGLFPCADVSETLLPLIDHKTIGPEVADYFRRNPREAARTLGPRLLESSKKAARAIELLTSMARSDGEALAAASADVDPRVKSAIAKLLGAASAASAVEEASPDELPAILREPPWRSKAPRATPRIVTDLPVLPYVEAVDQAAVAISPAYADAGLLSTSELDLFEKQLAESLAKGERPRSSFGGAFVHVHRLTRERALSVWNETPVYAFWTPEWAAGFLLGKYGVAAIPGAVALAEASDAEALAALAHCDTPRAARAMARASKRRSARTVVAGWLGRYPRAAATGLLPLALGPLGRDRDLAGDCVRWLATSGHEQALREVGRAHGIEEVVSELLAFDPRLACPAKPPKLSAFFAPESLPRLMLRNGKLVPLEQVGILGEMLQFSPIDPPYVGLAEAKAALDPRSLDAFLWSLLGAWIQAGGASANAWAMFALGHLGGDGAARQLAPAIKRWPREKAKPRALMGIDVLGMIGTDVALMHLSDLAAKGKNAQIEYHAKTLLAQVAAARGLDEEALGDRLVPDLGLDRGTCTLDYGPRSFEVRFSPELEPVLFDDGKPIKSLPRPGKDDDAEKAKAAQATWKALKEDAKAVTASLRMRLERAMCDGRAWESSSFRTLMLEHPLTQLAARRLVWATVDDAGTIPATFRIAEDDTLADADDALFTLGDDDLVTLPHPLRLDPEARTRWSSVLADYEILPPFPQLERELATAPDVGDTNLLPGVPTREIPYHVLIGTLESRGWKRSGGDVEGGTNAYDKRVAGHSASLTFSPPAYFREPPPERVTIGSVYFDRVLREVSPIAYSEVARDIGVFGG